MWARRCTPIPTVATLVAALMCLGVAAPASKLPPYMGACHRSDPALNSCLRNSINLMIKEIKSGSKELEVPPIDPLLIPLYELQQGSGNVSLHMTFKDTLVAGLSNTQVVSVKANLEDKKFEVASKTPSFQVDGTYMCEGDILSVPLSGDGDFQVNMSDVTAVWIFYYQSLVIKGQTYISIEKFILDVIPADISYRFSDILNGDNKLGAAMNTFLNENSHEIFNDVKPSIMEFLSDILTVIGNQVLSNFPEDVVLPP